MSLSVTLGRPHPEHARIDSGILEPVQESSMKGCRSSGYMLRIWMEDTQSKEGKVHGNMLCTLCSRFDLRYDHFTSRSPQLLML